MMDVSLNQQLLPLFLTSMLQTLHPVADMSLLVPLMELSMDGDSIQADLLEWAKMMSSQVSHQLW